MKSRRLFIAAAVAAAISAATLVSSGSDSDGKWAGSRSPAVHRIPLMDEDNQKIIPTEKNAPPFSTRYTCAPCHIYETIAAGRHFNSFSSQSPSGRPGEPWVWLDERTGTQIPVSSRGWPGMFAPADLGLSAWDFTALFGRHLPGGGPAEPKEEDEAPDSRWRVSGKAEINCLACHNAAKLQDHSEWARQMLRENFRWAATAAAGLGEVGGMASRLKGTWDPADGPNPDDTEWAVVPTVKYDPSIFDSKFQAFFDLAYPPSNISCLACHSNAPAGSRKFDFDDDVHTAAGLSCSSCHRNDVGHDIIRGYEGEAADNPGLVSSDFTCRACHLGQENKKGLGNAGRMGAPYPYHKGFPEVHFERLACTVCHSGPLPADEPARVRTARANRLGIFGKADWSTDLPVIVEPVYRKDTNGKLTPHRMMWPAYWGALEGEAVKPLHPETILAAAGEILVPERTVIRVLIALRGISDVPGEPVLVIDGASYEQNLDGGLTAHPAAGESIPAGWFFAAVKDGRIVPFWPDFDPADAETAAEPEGAVQRVLEALAAMEGAAGTPSLAYKNTMYALVEGSLVKSEMTDRAAGDPDWFWIKDGTRLPLIPDEDRDAIASLTGTEYRLTEGQVASVLEALAGSGTNDPVYISGGKLFRLDGKGVLEAVEHQAAEPVAWPMAHQVRPARQSLGWNGCTDCHSATSDFFFTRVEGRGPLRTASTSSAAGVSHMGLSNPYHRLFGLSYLGRPYFKIVLGIAAFLIGAVLLAALVQAVGRLSGLAEKRK
ncbi:MAG: hypothetical protein JW843_07115 [Candidatus Aminicenantes bacterium]|nr:hypothetical protein [Candidatus Aminicenantes bacterium]